MSDSQGLVDSGVPTGQDLQDTTQQQQQQIPIKRDRGLDDEEEDEDERKSGRERRKIEIKFIPDKSRRHITFSKRKAGIMKKAYELSVLTGTQVLLLVVSETGLVYTFTTPKLQPLVTKPEGKNLIQACLNAPEEPSAQSNGHDAGIPEDPHMPQQPPQQQQQQQQHPMGIPGQPMGRGMPGGQVPIQPGIPSNVYIPPEQAGPYQYGMPIPQQQQQQQQQQQPSYLNPHVPPSQHPAQSHQL